MPIMNGMNTGSVSDTSDGSSPDDKGLGPLCENGNDICRDYLRNVCKRGKRCKYRHPTPTEAMGMGRKQEYTFCHDFQNSGCRRTNCRFIHCTREEEEYYKQTGQLPVRLQQAAALGIGVVPSEMPLLQGEVPICKDYLKGDCKRAGRCKYRHLSSSQYDMELHGRTAETPRARVPETTQDPVEVFNNDDYERYDYELSAKRRRIEETYINYVHLTESASHVSNGLETTTFKFLPPSHTDYRLLEEENAMLRRKVEELKKQVSDLAATNEVLLEQNARYRANKVTAVVNALPPIVTVSQVVTPTISASPQAAAARAAIPPPVLQSLTPMTTIPHVTVNANHANELIVSQLALQPRLAGDQLGNQQQASIAPATAINPPSSVGPLNPAAAAQTMVPISLPLDTTIAPPGTMATVSMAQQQQTMPPPGTNVSMAPTTLPSAGTCTLLQGSGVNTPLVSYPIMSHTPLPNSSLG